MTLPGQIAWELDEAEDFEHVREELLAMTGLPVDLFIVNEDGSYKGRAILRVEESVRRRDRDKRSNLYLGIFGEPRTLRLNDEALVEARLCPGYVEARFDGFRLEIA